MTERIPAALEGQIADFSPLELWWDKNRRSIYTMVAIAIAAIAGYYGWKYLRDTKRDQLWSGVVEATKLDHAYSAQNPIFDVGRFDDPNLRQYRDYFIQQTSFRAAQSLVAELPEHLAKADLAEIEQQITKTKGTPAEPLLIWLAAHKAMASLDWSKAEAHLTALEQGFPKHFLTTETEYPPQYRDSEKPPEGEVENPKKNKPPKLLDAAKGSPVSMARNQIAREREFREQNKKFYEPPPPDADSKTVVMDTSLGTIKIKFYGSKAPKTVENFLKLVGEKFYDGLRVHEIVRRGTQQEFGPSKVASEFELGLTTTREEDRTKWIPPSDAPTLDWEDSGLSHFPYIVSMAQATAGKASANRFWINQTDAAHSADGMRVAFGVVVEGREIVDAIANSVLSTEDENRAGRGKPRDNIQIVKMTTE